MCELLNESSTILNFFSILDVIFKFATILIAAINVYFVIKIFRFNTKKDQIEREKDRKLGLLKTLVLDHNLSNFHSIFNEMESKLSLLKDKDLNDEKKKEVEVLVGELFIKLRIKFYDSLLAIDDNLYDIIKTEADSLQSNLSTTIFDDGVNLNHIPKFEELISQPLASTKTNIIKSLFKYRG